MKGEVYAIPVGMMGDQFVTTIEVFIPELDLTIGPDGSKTSEDLKESYQDYKKIADIEIPDEEKDNLLEFKNMIIANSLKEEEILSKLDEPLQEVVKKFQSEPQIHIPTMFESDQILNDDLPEGGGSIFLN